MYETALNERGSRIDWPLVVTTIGLMIIGLLFINSVTASQDNTPWYKENYVRQACFYFAGLVAIVFLCLVDYVSFARWSLVFYWASILLLVWVDLFGVTINGSKRWIPIAFGFNLQPSEFAKVAFIMVQANYLSRPQGELRNPSVIWGALGMTALPFLLILIEPDLGSALIFIPICLIMMFVAGVSRRFLAKLVGIGGLAAVVVVLTAVYAPPSFTPFIKTYQRERLYTYFGHSAVPKNATDAERKALETRRFNNAYNKDQALISVGSGGLTGKGWRQGTQHSLGFLPSLGAHNDFIFSVIAEEEGFIGSVVILTLYTVLLFSGIRIASQARDRLGKLMAIGVVALLFCHVFVNISMNISLMPVVGIPLPLLSYGGSSVVCSLIAIGILLNVHSYRRSY